MQFQTTANLNVRSGPGVDFEILDTLEKGDVVEEVVTEGWCPIAMDDGSIAWINRKYLIPQEAPEATPGPPVLPGVEPVWIRWARSRLGQKEVPGPGDNPEIAAWYRVTTLPEELWHDATAWCSVFCCAAMELNGIKSTRSALAFSWRNWGKKVATPQKGDIAIFSFSHVAFYLSGHGTGSISCLGGNQSNAVTIANFKESSVEQYRRQA